MVFPCVSKLQPVSLAHPPISQVKRAGYPGSALRAARFALRTVRMTDFANRGTEEPGLGCGPRPVGWVTAAGGMGEPRPVGRVTAPGCRGDRARSPIWPGLGRDAEIDSAQPADFNGVGFFRKFFRSEKYGDALRRRGEQLLYSVMDFYRGRLLSSDRLFLTGQVFSQDKPGDERTALAFVFYLINTSVFGSRLALRLLLFLADRI